MGNPLSARKCLQDAHFRFGHGTANPDRRSVLEGRREQKTLSVNWFYRPAIASRQFADERRGVPQ
jgi:hypothetical protein